MSKSYHCPSCGAEFVFNDKNIVKECLYCGSSISVIKKEISSMNIKKIIPFDISVDEVKELVDLSTNFLTFIKDIKKFYIPALFMECEVDYVAEYKYSSSLVDSSTISGKIYNQILPMSNIKYDYILGSDSFCVDKMKDVNILDVEDPIECCTLDISISDIAHKKAKEKSRMALQSNFNYEIEEIVDEQCFVTSLKKSEFLTLLPFYLVTLSGGTTILLNGSSYTEVDIKPKNNYFNIWLFSSFFGGLLIFMITGISYIGILFMFLFITVGLFLAIAYIVFYFKEKKVKKNTNSYFFDYRIYK